MRRPVDVKVKQISRADNTHAKQLRVLLREVRSTILRLDQQRVALNYTLAALRKVESQATAALARMAKPECRAA